ncbi:hypothetical protein V6N13_108151 [Hibiscus sabdariffa]
MSGPVDLDIFRICYYIDNKTSNGFDVYLVKNGIKDDESCVQALADTKTKVVMLLGPDTNNCVRIVSAQMQLEMWDVFHQSFVGEHCINIVHNGHARLIHLQEEFRCMFSLYLHTGYA